MNLLFTFASLTFLSFFVCFPVGDVMDSSFLKMECIILIVLLLVFMLVIHLFIYFILCMCEFRYFLRDRS